MAPSSLYESHELALSSMYMTIYVRHKLRICVPNYLYLDDNVCEPRTGSLVYIREPRRGSLVYVHGYVSHEVCVCVTKLGILDKLQKGLDCVLHAYCMQCVLHAYCMCLACVLHVYCVCIACVLHAVQKGIDCVLTVYCMCIACSVYCMCIACTICLFEGACV